jgi:hypothetical protein
MRMMRNLVLILAAVSLFMTLAAAFAAPPSTPEARERGRLKGGVKLEGVLQTHSEAVQIADVDCGTMSKSLSAEALGYIRYLDMHNIPPAQRQTYWGVVSVIMNGFTKTRQTIVLPAYGGPDNLLIRVNLFDYGIDPSAWDRLAKKDPYFHQIIRQTDVITKQVQTNELEWYKTGLYYGSDINKPEWKQRYVIKSITETSAPVKKQVQAAWLDAKAAGNLGVRLGTSYPILRADWFIANVTLEPHYSDFLGIKTLDDLKKFGGYDKRADVTEIKATIVTSGSDGLCARVARNNRILERRSTIYGDWWETYDFNSSIGDKNVILNFISAIRESKGKMKSKRDAAEYIVRAPNGLQWYMITDANDKALDKGDPEVVIDTMAQDALVRNGRSCIWCHTQGINPFKSHFQKQVGWKPDQADLGFYDKDPKVALILQQRVLDVFGAPNFDDYIKGDQARYDRAVRAASGMSAAEFSAAFKAIWDGYVEDYVDNVKACYELGLSPEELKMILGLRFEGKSNGVLIQALLEPPIAIRRDQWEESFFEAALLSTLKGQFKVVPVAPPSR